jgi:hypothetical protein
MDPQKIGMIFKRLLPVCQLADPDELEGCTEEQIAALMAAQGVEYLPAVYISFLKAVGVNGGRFSASFWYNYPKAARLKRTALFQEPGETRDIIELPKDAFVFWESGGLVYFFFQTQAQDPDPIVYLIDENPDPIISKTEETLSGFLFSFVHEMRPELFDEHFPILIQEITGA